MNKVYLIETVLKISMFGLTGAGGISSSSTCAANLAVLKLPWSLFKPASSVRSKMGDNVQDSPCKLQGRCNVNI